MESLTLGEADSKPYVTLRAPNLTNLRVLHPVTFLPAPVFPPTIIEASFNMSQVFHSPDLLTNLPKTLKSLTLVSFTRVRYLPHDCTLNHQGLETLSVYYIPPYSATPWSLRLLLPSLKNFTIGANVRASLPHLQRLTLRYEEYLLFGCITSFISYGVTLPALQVLASYANCPRLVQLRISTMARASSTPIDMGSLLKSLSRLEYLSIKAARLEISRLSSSSLRYLHLSDCPIEHQDLVDWKLPKLICLYFTCIRKAASAAQMRCDLPKLNALYVSQNFKSWLPSFTSACTDPSQVHIRVIKVGHDAEAAWQ